MNRAMPKAAEKVRGFYTRLMLVTECIHFFVTIPIVIYYIWANLNLTAEQLQFFSHVIVVSVVFAGICVYGSTRWYTAPVTAYFNKRGKGEPVGEKEALKAKRRFCNMPFIHSIGGGVRWIVLLAIPIMPLMLKYQLSTIQLINIWMGVFICALTGFNFNFLNTESMVQGMLNRGIFSEVRAGGDGMRLGLSVKLFIVITTSTLMPFLLMLACFIITFETGQTLSVESIMRLGINVFIAIFISTVNAVFTTIAIRVKLRGLIEFLEAIGRGSLDVEKKEMAVTDEISRINNTVNVMKESLKTMVGNISDTSMDLHASSGELIESSNRMTAMTNEQAAIIEEASSAFEEMASSFDSNIERTRIQHDNSNTVLKEISDITRKWGTLSSKTQDLREAVLDSVKYSEEGERVVAGSVATISEFAGYIEYINQIAGTISEVADQSNLLSLNAAIEAVRAGTVGKGFSVVAEAVSKLADRTTALAADIQKIIAERLEKVRGELENLGRTEDVFREIKMSIGNIERVITDLFAYTGEMVDHNERFKNRLEHFNVLANEIYTFTQDQKMTNEELVKNVDNMNEFAMSTFENSELVQKAAQSLNAKASELNMLVRQFRL
jgi:methyl-accepting chemotaxis protein